MTTRPAPLDRLRLLAALLLAGQGFLVTARILDHETPRLVGVLLLVGGLALAIAPALLRARRAATPPPASPPGVRAWLVAGCGALCVIGTLAYNLARGSDLSVPELVIVGYGATLLMAAPFLSRVVLGARVGTLVAYSFPLVLAPLSLFALNAALAAGAGGTPLALYIRHGLVVPMAGLIGLFGMDARMLGDTVALATPRGSLFLTVGVVCAGLYATVLFLGIFALFAWEQRTPPRRLAAYLALGVVGLHLANVLRLALLAVVGHRWGAAALQTAHQHAGWVLFLLWTLAFWWLVLRRFEGAAHARRTT